MNTYIQGQIWIPQGASQRVNGFDKLSAYAATSFEEDKYILPSGKKAVAYLQVCMYVCVWMCIYDTYM
jgi:hypothetical protein